MSTADAFTTVTIRHLDNELAVRAMDGLVHLVVRDLEERREHVYPITTDVARAIAGAIDGRTPGTIGRFLEVVIWHREPSENALVLYETENGVAIVETVETLNDLVDMEIPWAYVDSLRDGLRTAADGSLTHARHVASAHVAAGDEPEDLREPKEDGEDHDDVDDLLDRPVHRNERVDDVEHYADDDEQEDDGDDRHASIMGQSLLNRMRAHAPRACLCREIVATTPGRKRTISPSLQRTPS